MSLISVFLIGILIFEIRLNSFAFLLFADARRYPLLLHIDFIRLFIALVPQKPLHQKIRTGNGCNWVWRDFVCLLGLSKQREQWRAADLTALMLLFKIRASFPTWKVLEWIQTRVHFKVITTAIPAHVSSSQGRLI